MLNNYHRRPERIGLEIFEYNNHIDRLHKMKATLDTHTPHKLPKIIKPHNKLHLIQIEKQNTNLLYRIENACQTTRIDNILPKYVIEYSKFQKKIKRENHITEVKKIQENNIKLLKRIQNMKSTINYRKLEYDYIQSRKKMKLMSLYPEYLPDIPK